MTWAIDETRRHITSRFGHSHLELAGPSLHALAERQEYARYHYQEVRRLLEDFRLRYLNTLPLLVVAHGQDRDARKEFDLAMTQIGAHVLSCVLSIHAIADVMAFAVYQSLGYGLQPNALDERSISVTTVQKALRLTESHTPIAELMQNLCADPCYKHVAALANKSKHQALVKPVLNEDWTGTREERHELRFMAFKHDGKSFPEKELTSLLWPAYSLASCTVVDVGNQLNALFTKNAV